MVAVLVGFSVGATTTSFLVRIGEGERLLSTPVLDRGGVPYVSLSSLVDQLGGACTVSPERIQVDLAAKTAWMHLVDTRVNASLADFSLRYPILKHEADVAIALHDVIPFFEEAFRLAVSKAQRRESPPETTRPRAVQETAEPPQMKALAPLTTPQSPPAVGTPVEVVIIDPGHGGSDLGCEGQGGLAESTLSFAVARQLQARLDQFGVATFLTRGQEYNPSLSLRASLANSNKGGLLVSIHTGASYGPNAHGFELFCCSSSEAQAHPDPKSGRRLAPGSAYVARSWEIAESVAKAVEETTGAENRGVCEVNSPLLRRVAMPGFLIEIGFLTNAAEGALLRIPDYQKKIAQGIAAGLQPYLLGSRSGGRQ